MTRGMGKLSSNSVELGLFSSRIAVAKGGDGGSTDRVPSSSQSACTWSILSTNVCTVSVGETSTHRHSLPSARYTSADSFPAVGLVCAAMLMVLKSWRRAGKKSKPTNDGVHSDV